MVVGEAVIVAGIGSRKGVTVDDVLAAIDAALAEHGLTRARLDRLATVALKAEEPALLSAATTLRLEIVVADPAALDAAGRRALTHSDRSLEIAGMPSVSEASALAAAGSGSRLLGPRVVVGPVTCALATSGDAP